jgi:hypothetical protein
LCSVSALLSSIISSIVAVLECSGENKRC